MSAVEVSYDASPRAAVPQFHVVHEGEISASSKRRAFARSAARVRSVAAAKTYAAFVSMATVFTAAAATIVWAFLSVPNTPLP